ncbi:hypothetical protein EIKCOROL_00465 [Eikenella corrodens ATCC 23834]|uniref:Uncharacterized protein n=1 Tax=Eikenella corrodens ATCC 23834 TaxID=546274 RepID=C0DSZ0_EIKCO|nr:hypothetical protein EIKCOROL_00465 [Eikenella corrodens ATCC 23834]
MLLSRRCRACWGVNIGFPCVMVRVISGSLCGGKKGYLKKGGG